MFVSHSPIRITNVHPVERVASVIGGGLLALSGIRMGVRSGGARILAGSEMVRRGVTGKCYLYQTLGMRTASPGQGKNVSVPYELGISVREAITIYKPRGEVYGFWRALSNLPRFMKHLKSVEHTGPNRTHLFNDAAVGSLGMSYPSGHVANALVWYGVIALLAGALVGGLAPRTLVTLRVLPPVIVFCTTTYLSFHWITDSVAGLFLGLVLIRLMARVPWDTMPLPHLKDGWDRRADLQIQTPERITRLT